MATEVVVFACQQAVPDPEVLRRHWGKTGARLQVISEPCSSKVEAFQLLRTMSTPADLVWVIGCREDLCRYHEGSRRLANRVEYTQTYLAEIGLETHRLGYTLVVPGEAAALAEAVAGIKARLEALGTSPLKAGSDTAKTVKV